MGMDVQLYIAGRWREGGGRNHIDIDNPATGEVIGAVAVAETADLEEAVSAAAAAWKGWRETSAYERSKILRRAADHIRSRASGIARSMTIEQGKPLADANAEIAGAADALDWFAEEGRRAYGRIIPSRSPLVHQQVTKEPVGPVCAFTPWNFPISQITRKVAAALTTGCPIIVKAAEETPNSAAALVGAFEDAGLPPGVLNLVFGVPAHISEYLVPHPAIRKVSFTGSVAVGQHLAALAGRHMKRTTMELGGHAPFIVCNDADVERAAAILSATKFRNAGQVCISPTRILVQEDVFGAFVEAFEKNVTSIVVGSGLEPDVTMGPLAHERRVVAYESFIQDAVANGATVKTGGERINNRGSFVRPTILVDVPKTARIFNEEPFCPIAPVAPFGRLEDAIEEANRLPYGLAAYAFTRSQKNAALISSSVEAGMISINHYGLAFPETPFGGVKDSGIGSEGGAEALEAYLQVKFTTIQPD